MCVCICVCIFVCVSVCVQANEEEIERVAHQLRQSTKVLTRNLQDNPNLEGNMQKIQVFFFWTTEQYVSTKEQCVSTKEQNISTNEPYVLKICSEQYVSTKNPIFWKYILGNMSLQKSSMSPQKSPIF